jgi:hypothetical protein
VDAAVALAHESLSLGRQLGDRRGMALAQSTLGRMARRRGDPVVARRWYADALRTHVELHDTAALTSAVPELAEFAREDARPDVAAGLERATTAIDGDLDAAVTAALSWLTV